MPDDLVVNGGLQAWALGTDRPKGLDWRWWHFGIFWGVGWLGLPVEGSPFVLLQ